MVQAAARSIDAEGRAHKAQKLLTAHGHNPGSGDEMSPSMYPQAVHCVAGEHVDLLCRNVVVPLKSAKTRNPRMPLSPMRLGVGG